MQVNLRVLCSVTYRTFIHYIVCLGSILFYYVFLILYSILRPGALNKVGKSDNAYWVILEASTKFLSGNPIRQQGLEGYPDRAYAIPCPD